MSRTSDDANAPTEYVLAEPNEGKTLVTIRPDGKVEWSAPEDCVAAAKVFYEALQVEGMTLHQTIASQRAEIKKLREVIGKALDENFCGREPATTSDGCYTDSPTEKAMRDALKEPKE